MRPGILISLATLLLFGCNLPVAAATTSVPASGTVLYKDDFSSPTSGWDHTKYEEGIMDYDQGAYRMLVNAPDLNFWATPHKDFTDTRIEVDSGKMAGPDENRIGLICRSDGKNYYFFIITSDGYYGIGLFNNGQAKLLGQQQLQTSDAIRKGVAVNHLRADCKGAGLEMYVNGLEVAKASDPTLKHGDAGLLAGTFKQTGADVVFDNFMVFAP
ncbi:MAG TPA: hypothetical protein VMJ64_00080 [Anaerolineales bacterium]|nr:hypothetical protein [Anaerolineales bacterium]